MRPIDFNEANATFEKPPSMTDEDCLPIRARIGEDSDNMPFIDTAWMPNKEDIEAILSGKPVYLRLISKAMPPHVLFTLDDDGNPNN